MSKLILGIIAVVALQIAFFAYISNEGGLGAGVTHVRTILPAPGHPAGRSNNSPEVSLGPAAPVPRTRNDARSVTRRRLSTGSRKKIALKSAPVVDRAVLTVASTPWESSSRGVVRRVKREPRLIPSGHTMMLIDHIPNLPQKEVTAIRKQKRRSYLERTLPALVRKPWNFIKSVASKLD